MADKGMERLNDEQLDGVAGGDDTNNSALFTEDW